jgi:hypothetical protein
VNIPAYFLAPFRLPGPKPFGCQKSNRMRIATQAKNAQSINNHAAKELFQRVKDGGIAQRSRLNWRNSANINPEI